MIKNFFIIAWRNLIRKKSFSFINITGLAIGMAAAVLILLWIENEVSYDKFHAKKDRLYEVWNRYKNDGNVNCWNNTPTAMAEAIQKDYPEVEKTARIKFLPPVQITLGEKKISGRGRIVDSSFLQMFSYPLLKGNTNTALNNAYSIALTEKLAKKIFGDENPMGKIIRVDNTDNFTVSAILKDPPLNSKFEFEFLIGWAYMRYKQWDNADWGNNSIDTYVLLKSGASLSTFQAKIKSLRKSYDRADPGMETFLYPITRTHLYGSFENGVESGGRVEIVRLFGLVASFILLIACINFMNLSTARSEKRAKEVGIRKVVGAQKKSLIFQFLGESVLLAFIASIFAFFIVEVTLAPFNQLVNKKLFIDLGSSAFWIAGFAFVMITGLLAGSYPAIYLSSFRPISVLKGSLKAINALVTPRKILVIAQFTFAIVLIIATIIVRQQIQTAQDRQVGYAKNNLVYHFMEGKVETNYMLIKNELLANGAAVAVTKTSAPITEGWSNTWAMEWKGKEANDKTIIDRFSADDAVVKTMGLKLVEGRDFDLASFPTDSSAAIINESAARHMGFIHPIGQIVKDNGIDWHVVGVIKDFILTSPYHPTEPMVIAGAKGWFNVIHIKLNEENTTEKNVALLKQVFKKYNPDYELNYRFADEEYARKFDDEKRTRTLASLFAMLTIIISCLGLFGLSSYMAENRIKEIGVRKVLGASVGSITMLLSKDFLKLVLIAVVIASPIAYWAMFKWLQSFPYHTAIKWWVFVLAGMSALFIALLTVSFQSIRAGMTNPVKSLRSE